MTAEAFALEFQHASGPPGVVTLRLEQAGRPVVVLDEALVRRLDASLRAVPRDAAGLIIASSAPRAFIAGADLKSINELDDAALHAYLRFTAGVFGRLSQMPMPTVAAIHGAALGGGLELAMHCDALIACPPAPGPDATPGKPYPVGLPEAGLSICPGWGGTNLLPARIDPEHAIRQTAEGKPMTFDQARDAGLFDEVAPSPAELIPTARAWVLSGPHGEPRRTPARDGAPSRWIGRPDRSRRVLEALDRCKGSLPATQAARAVALGVETGLLHGWAAALDAERDALVRLRHTPEAKSALAAFFAKSAPPKG